MTWYAEFPAASSTGDIYLEGGDGFLVPKNASLLSYNGGILSVATNRIIVAGSLTSIENFAVFVAGQNLLEGGPSGSSVRIEATGEVRGLAADAVGIFSSDATLDNAGIIAAEDGVAVGFGGEGAGTLRIVNTGVIKSNLDAMERGNNRTSTVELQNFGTIEAGKSHFSYYSASDKDAIDLVVNNGKMIGSISLSLGNDIYDGHKGTFSGNFINGGGGGDKILGGSSSEYLLGGAGRDMLTGNGGNDKISGEADRDTLTGGSGKDTFQFDAAVGTGNYDSVTDFVAVDDTINLFRTVFSALPLGTLATGAFAQNLTGKAAQPDDRVIYETDTGNLFYDADGTGSGAGQVFAVLKNAPAITNNDFIIF